jgi:iron(III) transport system ATP-binding protein
MGNNNRIEGQVMERRGASALLSGDGWQLWGQARGENAGVSGTGMIRLEHLRLADGPGINRLRLPLVTSMFLGDRWEYLFHDGNIRFRAYGQTSLATGEHWLEVPQEHFWVF